MDTLNRKPDHGDDAPILGALAAEWTITGSSRCSRRSNPASA